MFLELSRPGPRDRDVGRQSPCSASPVEASDEGNEREHEQPQADRRRLKRVPGHERAAARRCADVEFVLVSSSFVRADSQSTMREMVSSGRPLARRRRVAATVLALSCDGGPGGPRSVASQEALPLPEPDPQATAPVAFPTAPTPAIAGAPAAPIQLADTEPCPRGSLLVPGGRFSAKQYATLQMSAAWAPDDPESRLVLADHVADFCLDRTEFTVDRCRLAGGCKTKYPAPAEPSRDAFPIEVGDVKAASLCASEGGRLPTYEEWMWAYWGGEENRKYPWGREKPSPARLNVCDISCSFPPLNGDAPDCETVATCKGLDRSFGDDGWQYSAPVGTYPRGAARWGQLDMEGNVDEVVAATPTLRYFFSMQISGWQLKRDWPPIQAFHWHCGSTYQSGPRELRSPVCGGPWSDDGSRSKTGFRCAFTPHRPSLAP